MNFNNLDELKQNGFKGFKTIKDLLLDSTVLPMTRGVYLVLNTNNKNVEFLSTGSGGFFKGKNPNVSISELEANWVDNTIALYIGKAGGINSQANLRSRLRQYLRFGQGKNVGHWGGRFIWQLRKSEDLIICWKELPNQDPREEELTIIKDFVRIYGKRPFANLVN